MTRLVWIEITWVARTARNGATAYTLVHDRISETELSQAADYGAQEGSSWVRGHVTSDSCAGRALLTTFMLLRGQTE